MLLDYLEAYGAKSLAEEPLNYLDLIAFGELSGFEYPADAVGRTLAQALPQTQSPSIPAKKGGRIITMGDADDAALKRLVATGTRWSGIRVAAFDSAYAEGVGTDAGQFAGLALCICCGADAVADAAAAAAKAGADATGTGADASATAAAKAGASAGAVASAAAGAAADTSTNDLIIVSFRATDTTLTGWHESLRLSLQTPGFAQRHAAQFFRKVTAETRGPIVLCGHSKGGNLAQYAAMACVNEDANLAARIAVIASFDGPGLSLSQRRTPGYRALRDRMITFIPKSSFIGRINEHPSGSIVYVDSTEHMGAQHSVYTWKTQGTHLVGHQQSLYGRLTSTFMKKLVDNLNDRQKSGLFSTIFLLPRLQGKQTFDDDNRAD